MTLTDLLDIELPLIQAPMAGAQGSELAIAVSNAGGLGSLPCALLGLDAMRTELAAIRAGTDRPYNVNFFCHVAPTFDAEREAAWRQVLLPYYQAYKLNAVQATVPPSRSPFTAEVADVLEEYRPPVVSFHFGLPAADLVARVKSWGSKVLATATTVDEAAWLEERGVDAIIAQGLEAGGHRGMFLAKGLTTQSGTFALLPQVAARVKVPVIAAGGIADAKGLMSSMWLGAAGAQIGTAYLLCPESTTSAVHRAALTSKRSRHTAVTNLYSGRPARGIVNRLMTEIGPLSDAAPAFPLASGALAPLRAKAELLGVGDFSPLWCGQNATGCKEISAADLTREFAAQL